MPYVKFEVRPNQSIYSAYVWREFVTARILRSLEEIDSAFGPNRRETTTFFFYFTNAMVVLALLIVSLNIWENNLRDTSLRIHYLKFCNFSVFDVCLLQYIYFMLLCY